MNYRYFFIFPKETNNRAVSCLKFTNLTEEIIKGKLTIDYFYNLKTFNNDKIKIIMKM